MGPADRRDKAENVSADESSSGPREIEGGTGKRQKRRGRSGGALFSKRKSDTALRDGMPRPGTVVSGRFRIERLVAKGGMGTVWEGVDLELDRPVAVKFMDPTFADKDELRDRFTREAKAAAKLRTKHVVEVHEFGIDGETPFIVMELLEGEDLHSHLKRVKRVDLQTAAAIVVQCCRALKKAADAHIVHRDLKPGNVYLSRDLDEIVVKILDFGVAKLIDSHVEVTRAGTMLGSPQYMSPEQAVGEPVDHRSDLWSISAIIYRMLTGKIAFTGKTAGDIIIKLCTAPLPVPSKVNPDLPRSIDKFFEKAFQRDPDLRFQSAAELSQAFVAAVAEAQDEPDPGRYASLSKYPNVSNEHGEIPSIPAPPTPVSLPGTPISGVLSPSDSASGTGPHAALSADDLLSGPLSPAKGESSGRGDSENPTEVTRAADLERADKEQRDKAKASASGKVDASEMTVPDAESIAPRKRHSLGFSDLEVKHRGLPPVVWVLFIAAMGVGAFIAFFVQSKPETDNLLDNLNLQPPKLPVSASAAATATEIDPLLVTPEPEVAPSASASASASASVSAGAPRPPPPFVAPKSPGVWPPKAPQPPPPPPVKKDPYD